MKPRAIRINKIIEIRAELNKIENQNTKGNINTTKSWVIEEINEIGKPLARVGKKHTQKYSKLEMKEKLEHTPQKYKG